MSDDRNQQVRHSGEDPAEVAAREARHEVLRDLLAAYADRELPAETTSQIDAHLVGCTRCRRELDVHVALRGRLEVEPPSVASSALRDRIGAAIASTPVALAPREPRPTPHGWMARWRLLAAAAALAIVAGAGVLRSARRPRADAVPAVATVAAAALRIPLVDSVLADYRRATAADLPGRARDLDAVRTAVPFAVEALHVPGLRLLGAWTTSLGGEPAAVLAYRADDRVILEYLVSDDRFFQHPAIRRGVAGGHYLAITDRGQSVLAWPSAAAGAFLVGELPPARLASFAAEDALARQAVRGAP